MAVLVTGGTGFIGNILCRRLVEAGERVHVLARKTSDLSGLEHKQIKIFYGDITDQESIKAALIGSRRVFHLAAYAKNWARDSSLFRRVNVDGLSKLLEAALGQKIEKVVFISSSVSIGSSVDGTCTESSLRQEKACFTEYEQSKCLAEEKAAEFTAKGLFLATACPTRVYGPGKLTEANSVTKMIRMYLRNRIGLVLARGTEVGNYVLAEDVVEGLLKIMDKGRNGERYILGGENISLSGFYDLLKEVSGRRALRVPVPKKLAFAIAGLEESLAGRFGIYPFITRDWVETFLQNWAFSSRKAEQELGYRPKTLREGLAITCAWLGYPVQSRLQERGRP